MPANYVLLERITTISNVASVVFDNIPQTGYTDLKLVASSRQSTASIASDVTVNFNGTSANNFNKFLYGDSASVGTGTDGYGPTRNYFSIGTANNATANTFGSVEMYIPNYTSSNQKTFSIDSVGENNGTTSVFQLMVAGRWADTAAITSIALTPVTSALFLTNSEFSLYGIAATGTTPVIAPKASGGDIIETNGTYWFHTFLGSGTFIPNQNLSCDYLVVAGGGGGGGGLGGGGGAGGFRTGSSLSLTQSTNYAVTIGAGGAAGSPSALVTGSVGANSTFASITSSGGGGGAGSNPGAPTTGGSGGGGTYNKTTGAAGNSGGYSPVEGYAGGTGFAANPNFGGGGGGGASAIGGTYVVGVGAGVGGAGTASSISGTSVTYAGGGGGCFQMGTGAGGLGGAGGGGNGGNSNSSGVETQVATSGTANRGGGGGSGYTAGAGGSGIVIVRYAV